MNKKVKKHEIIKIEDCKKSKNNFLKERLSDIESNIDEAKKKFIKQNMLMNLVKL